MLHAISILVTLQSSSNALREYVEYKVVSNIFFLLEEQIFFEETFPFKKIPKAKFDDEKKARESEKEKVIG
jgi:hypothetical protein